MDILELIENGSAVIDVRSPMEFMMGHAPGSVNIPLNEIPQRVDELKDLQGPLVMCCASGNRSGQACGFLADQGIECVNAGSWTQVNYELARKAG